MNRIKKIRIYDTILISGIFWGKYNQMILVLVRFPGTPATNHTRMHLLLLMVLYG